MSNELREKFLSKIKNLLKKTVENGATKAEAEASILLAQKLMAKYKIEESELDDVKEKTDIIEEFIFEEFKKRRGWIYILGDIIAENFSCYSLQIMGHRSSNLMFVGHRSDIEIAKAVFLYAYDVLRQSSLEYARKIAKLEGGNQNRIRNDYIVGFLVGIEEKFDLQREEIQEETGLILLKDEAVSQFVEENIIVCKSRGPQMTTGHNYKAYEAGKERGKKLSYNDKLTS
ncbi:MAG: DUF2786 domain-containing protein [Candidatus Woesearchaeota archaeon]